MHTRQTASPLRDAVVASVGVSSLAIGVTSSPNERVDHFATNPFVVWNEALARVADDKPDARNNTGPIVENTQHKGMIEPPRALAVHRRRLSHRRHVLRRERRR